MALTFLKVYKKYLQSGPSGRGEAFVDIERVAL